MRFQSQIKFLNVLDGLQWDGAFYRLPDARVNVLERMLLFRQFLFHGTVVNGTEYAHIKGNRVGADALAFEPGLVKHHGVAVYLAQEYVLPLTELHKTGQCRRIGFGCTDFAKLLQLSYDALHEAEQRLFARLPVEFLDDTVSGINSSLPVALGDYGFQPSGVPVDTFRHLTEVPFPVFADFGQNFQRGSSLVPFRIKYAVVRLDLADYAPVDYLIIYAALLAACGGRTVLYFDGCHSLYFCRLD